MEVGFGLTNGFWDIVWDTRIPEEERAALYAGMHRRRPEESDVSQGDTRDDWLPARSATGGAWAPPVAIERSLAQPDRPRLAHAGDLGDARDDRGGTSLSTSISITARPLPGLRPTVMRAMLMGRSPSSVPMWPTTPGVSSFFTSSRCALRDRVHLDAVHVHEAQVVAAEERARHREVAARWS